MKRRFTVLMVMFVLIAVGGAAVLSIDGAYAHKNENKAEKVKKVKKGQKDNVGHGGGTSGGGTSGGGTSGGSTSGGGTSR